MRFFIRFPVSENGKIVVADRKFEEVIAYLRNAKNWQTLLGQ
jgi:hypothetical protein